MTYRIDDIVVPESDPFENDRLERKPVVDFLTGLIGRLDGPFVMALDSPFGMGKSTLVRILIQCLRNEGHRCIYFNAWKVDYATDPVVALVASIDHIELGLSDENERKIYQTQIREVRRITTALARTSVENAIKVLTSGLIDPEAISSAVKSSESESGGNRDLVAEFNQESELFDKFRDELSKAVELLRNDDSEQESTDNTRSNLVFFVDELDRCRPTFAVQLLERIKHLFDIPNIVFVLSLDKKQIEASIKAVYGTDIDAPEYLRRFFNLEYGIPAANTQRYIYSLMTRFDLNPIFDKRIHQPFQHDSWFFIEFLTLLANAMGLSLRAIERCMTRMRIVMDQTPSDHYLDPVLVALLIVLHSNKRELFDQILNGQGPPEDVIEYLNSLSDYKLQGAIGSEARVSCCSSGCPPGDIVPVIVPVQVCPAQPKSQHAVDTGGTPPAARQLEPGLDHMTVSAFHLAGSDRQFAFFRTAIIHLVKSVFQIPIRLAYRRMFLDHIGRLQMWFQLFEHLLCLIVLQPRLLRPQPLPHIVAETLRGLRQILAHMDEVHQETAIGTEPLLDLPANPTGPVTDHMDRCRTAESSPARTVIQPPSGLLHAAREIPAIVNLNTAQTMCQTQPNLLPFQHLTLAPVLRFGIRLHHRYHAAIGLRDHLPDTGMGRPAVLQTLAVQHHLSMSENQFPDATHRQLHPVMLQQLVTGPGKRLIGTEINRRTLQWQRHPAARHPEPPAEFPNRTTATPIQCLLDHDPPEGGVPPQFFFPATRNSGSDACIADTSRAFS